MTMRTVVFVAALVGLGTPCLSQAPAQTPGQRLIEQARAQIDAFTLLDSARVLLETALRLDTARAVRTRAYTLLGFAHLSLTNPGAARQAFVQALRLDPALRIDSLDLDPNAPLVFNDARIIAGASAATETREARVVLLLTVLVPADTVIAHTDARVPIIVQPNAAARTVTTIAAAEQPGVPVWSDTQTTSARHRIAWPLRRPDGTLWPEGRYLLRSQATDSNGQATPYEERVLRVARVPVDTQAHPPELPATAFAPEMLPPVRFTAPRLVAGSTMALLVAVMPSMLGSPDLNNGLQGDPTSYAVAGTVAVASVVGFIKGRRPQPLKQNIEKNKVLRANDQRQRDVIEKANADALGRAPIRVSGARAP